MTALEKAKIEKAIHLIANTENFEGGMEILFTLIGRRTRCFKELRKVKGTPINKIPQQSTFKADIL